MEGEWEHVRSQNGGSLRTRGVKKYQEMNITRGREPERERERERHVGRKKETGRSRCVSVHSRRNQVPRCVLPRARRGRSGGGDVGGSGRIDRVWAATNPRFSSLPFVDPFFLSSPLIHAPGTFLSSPFVSLLFDSRSLYLQPFLSSVLTARSSFLPASPFIVPFSCSFSAFLSLPISFPSSFSS